MVAFGVLGLLGAGVMAELILAAPAAAIDSIATGALYNAVGGAIGYAGGLSVEGLRGGHPQWNSADFGTAVGVNALFGAITGPLPSLSAPAGAAASAFQYYLTANNHGEEPTAPGMALNGVLGGIAGHYGGPGGDKFFAGLGKAASRPLEPLSSTAARDTSEFIARNALFRTAVTALAPAFVPQPSFAAQPSPIESAAQGMIQGVTDVTRQLFHWP